MQARTHAHTYKHNTFHGSYGQWRTNEDGGRQTQTDTETDTDTDTGTGTDTDTDTDAHRGSSALVVVQF